MIETTCCFTGHRMLASRDHQRIEQRVKVSLEQAVGRGYIHFLCGGALGFDMLAGYGVTQLKKKYPHIRLEMVLPCRDQSRRWRISQQEMYEELLALADSRRYLQESYSAGCMERRNQYMVDHSSHCIAYFKGTQIKSGTGATIRYAVKKGVLITNLADYNELGWGMGWTVS